MREYVLRAVALPTRGEYISVSHGDDSHVVNMATWQAGPLSRHTPICGEVAAENAPTMTGPAIITCPKCISIWRNM